MATPFFTQYPTLATLMMGSRGIECFDFAQLKRLMKRHAGNFAAAGVAGRTARSPVTDELTARIKIRLNGKFTQDNAAVAPASQPAQYAAHEAALFAVLAVNTLQTIELVHAGGTATAQCQVVEIDGPVHDSNVIARVSVRLHIPAGPLLW
jgi:hypothetical protein